MARIVVCGYGVRHPVAGNMLAFVHYLVGFARLGHRVAYLEESGWAGSCYDPRTHEHSDDPTYGMALFQDVLARYGLDSVIGFVNRETGRCYGLDRDDVVRLLRDCDLLLNIGGVSWLPEFEDSRRRALVDMDPFFTQVGSFANEGHELYHEVFSYGLNIGQADCTVPTLGRVWHPLPPPVVPEIWAQPAGGWAPERPFTTVANWNAYGSVRYKGAVYGQKREEFLQLSAVPARSAAAIELAVSSIGEADRRQMEAGGWRVRDAELSDDLGRYCSYLANASGEFSAAKHAYVATRSGWFSDRSVCYLAAGRPAVLQDTGFSKWIDCGKGLMPFSNPDEALQALAAVVADYERHRQAARDLAEETFSYRQVLPMLLERAGVG